MAIGFSFSPGGLLLLYHVGALASLQHEGYVPDTTPLAGSSAGSIAVVSHGCGLKPETILEATIAVSDQCEKMGSAQGNLLPLLENFMNDLIDNDRFEQFQSRTGPIGVAYRELFPRNQPILQTSFQDKAELIESTLNSCMFPFFSTPWPCRIDRYGTGTMGIPRVVVDGYFTVPRDRLGCPDFAMANVPVDRTITVSCFPHERIGLTASLPENRIGPSEEYDLGKLLGIATEFSSRPLLTEMYELGWQDAETWCRQEDGQQQMN